VQKLKGISSGPVEYLGSIIPLFNLKAKPNVQGLCRVPLHDFVDSHAHMLTCPIFLRPPRTSPSPMSATFGSSAKMGDKIHKCREYSNGARRTDENFI